MSKVQIIESGPNAGIWVTADDGSSVALCAGKHGAYIQFRSDNSKPLPDLVVGISKGRKPFIQDSEGKQNDVN